MCGIAGIICLNSSQITGAKALQQMANAMVKRGPDDEGYLLGYKDQTPVQPAWGQTTYQKEQIPSFYQPQTNIEQLYNKPADVFLAHRRLSIIDLTATGHQPMSSKDGRYWIVYNGEVYNYKEIAEELAQHNVMLVGKSDTEVVLQAYILWGTNALEKFNGMFAFAIWDNQEKTLFCARDRVGIKPFYYTIQDGMFIFGSEIKTIIASGLYKPTVNTEGLFHAMSYGAAPRPMTCFKDVFALKQSHWMKIDVLNNDFKEGQYWEVPIGCQDHSMTEKQAISLVDEALNESIKRRLIADVPVGTFMSGGVDSTTVSAIAAKYHPHIKAFTLGYEVSDGSADKYDELDQAKATASITDMEHIIEIQRPETLIDNIDEVTLLFEEPFFSLPPNYLISKLVSKHNIKVVLNGLGGDELFAGYQTFYIAKHHRLLKTFFPMLKLASMFYPRFRRTLDIPKTQGIGDMHGALMNNMSTFEKKRLINDPSVQNLYSFEKLREFYFPKDKKFSDLIEAMCYMYVMNYIGNHHTYRVDQHTMNFSIEGRFPLLDHKLIELAFTIPSKYKMKGNTGKYVLKEVAKNYIHPSCLSMKKKGFNLPVDYWIRNTLHEFVEERLANLAKRDLFNRDEIYQIYKNFQRKLIDDYTLWQLIGIELWFEHLIDPYQ